MRNSDGHRNPRGLIIVCVTLLAVAAGPQMLFGARPTSSINVVNNSSRTIRNVYLSHVNADDWGSNQLGETQIAPGQSFTISNVSWDEQQVKVIGEDQDGCFLSGVVTAGSDSTWTITNDTTADCGGGS